MTDGLIHLWLDSGDSAFAEVLLRAMGSEVELQLSEGLNREERDLLQRWSDVVILDLREIGCAGSTEAGLELLQQLVSGEANPPLPVIVLYGDFDRETGRRARDLGASDVLAGPPNLPELKLAIRKSVKFNQAERELHQLRTAAQAGCELHGVIGFSDPMQKVFALVKKTAPCDVTVLITGETGTGKGLLARAIHRLSGRVNGPFVSFSCANLPDTLVEDELFGHEKGAFTGAMTMRRGRFEAADSGTLFLDEIGDLALGLQAKLLRVLQERCIERLGSNTSINTNIRLVAATHKNLSKMVESREFRQDLFYRLNVVQIHLPPLRERREEISVLAQHFLGKFSKEFGKNVRLFSRQTLDALEEYEWPGNVRELENVVQRAVVMAEGSTVEVDNLPAKFQQEAVQPVMTSSTYEEEVRNFRRRLLLRTLSECNWCKVEAARRLGMARSYLHRMITQLELVQPGSPPERELTIESHRNASETIM